MNMLQSSCPLSIINANFPLISPRIHITRDKEIIVWIMVAGIQNLWKIQIKSLLCYTSFLLQFANHLTFFLSPSSSSAHFMHFFLLKLIYKNGNDDGDGGLKSLFNVNHYDIQFPLLASSLTPLGSTLLETLTWIWAFWRIPKYNGRGFVIFVVMKEGVEGAKNNGLFYHTS